METQEGPQRTTEWDETTKSPIISLVNRSVRLCLLSPSACFPPHHPATSSFLNQPLIVPLADSVVLISGLAQTSSLTAALLTCSQTLNKHILMWHQSCHLLNEPSSPPFCSPQLKHNTWEALLARPSASQHTDKLKIKVCMCVCVCHLP